MALFLVGVSGFKLTVLSGIIILVFIFLAGVFSQKCFKKCDSSLQTLSMKPDKLQQKKTQKSLQQQIIRALLIGVVTVFFILLAIFTFSKAGGSASEQATWGFKAKVMSSTNTIPISLFTDASEPYIHHSYPLGFPLLLTWSQLMIGGFDELQIKIVSFFLGILIYLLMFAICRREGLQSEASLLFPLFFCVGLSFIHNIVVLYAEPLLILFILSGTYLLYSYFNEMKTHYLRLGLWLLGCAGWIKNEGIVYFALALTILSIFFFFEKQKKSILLMYYEALFPLLVFLFPWLIFRYILEIRTYDFDFSQPYQLGLHKMLERLNQATIQAINYMFINFKDNCGIWYLFIACFFTQTRLILKNNGLRFLITFCVSIITVLIFVYLFSVRPLEWHLWAMQRTLLIPTTIAWIIVVCCYSKTVNYK